MGISRIFSYAERGQGVFNQVMRKTAPTAQVLKAKAKPLAEAVGTRMEAAKMRQFLHRPRQNESQQQQKDELAVTSGGVERAHSFGGRSQLQQQKQNDTAATTAAQQQR